MKANEYIKKYGLICAGVKLAEIEHSSYFNVFYFNLKRLFESHELVESYGGIHQARELAHKNCFDYPAHLLQAIADVESCM